MGNRDRHDIVMDILQKAKSGKNKTELMRDVGLSYSQSKQYLTILVEQGLLEAKENKRYNTSKKGISFMKKCGECFLSHWHT